MDNFVSGNLKECWLSAIGASDCVKLKEDVDGKSVDDKLHHFKIIGSSGYVALEIGCPRTLVNGFDYQKIVEEELKLENLTITFSNDDVFHLENK